MQWVKERAVLADWNRHPVYASIRRHGHFGGPLTQPRAPRPHTMQARIDRHRKTPLGPAYLGTVALDAELGPALRGNDDGELGQPGLEGNGPPPRDLLPPLLPPGPRRCCDLSE